MKPICIFLFACLLPVFGQQAVARTSVAGYQCGIEREVRAGALTEATYNRLTRIYEAISEEQHARAYEDLAALLERSGRDEYEQAVIQQAMAFVRVEQERYQEAIDLFQRAIDLDQLDNHQHFGMILQLAQLNYASEQYREALSHLDIWFCVTSDDQQNRDTIWVMKASIHARIDEFSEALVAIDQAIAISNEPQENWYQLKLAIHFELEQYTRAAEVLRVLINMNPERKDYWVQLASIYMQLDQGSEALAVLALAHREGLLDRQSEYMQLASLQQEFDFPRKAAEIMQEGLEQGIIESTRRNWELLAGAWYSARELDHALVAYERAGAESDDGKLDLQRGFILSDQERWAEAMEAIERALSLGGLSDSESGNAYLLLGMARFNSDDFDGALQAFNQAVNYGTVESAAREWMNHIRQERSQRSS